MKSVYNQSLFLQIIGILQPASAQEVHEYLKIALEGAGRMPDADAIHSLCMDQEQSGRIIRVFRDPDLFSLTERGNQYLSVESRKTRDKARLFLLKNSRKYRIFPSRGGDATGLDGDAPPADARPTLKGREANNLGPVVPSGQGYWPRFSRKLIDETCQQPPPRDVSFLPLLSFNDAKQVAIAGDGAGQCLDFSTLGLLLGISPRLILDIANKPERHYRQFPLPKKGGGERSIDAPRIFLKVIQQFLADYFLNGLPVHECVHSFRAGHSIISNASQHCRKPFVGNIDIQNYYGSITRRRIVETLRNIGYDAVSTEIVARLCTKDGIVPQGAPTSPALSNIFLFDFDSDMAQQCEARGLSYTRYADDISISGDDKGQILSMIALARDYLAGEYELELNDKKTRIASQGGQQRVTGVIVNEQPRPPRKFRREVRAAFHNAAKKDALDKKTISRLRGYVSYLRSFEALRDGKEVVAYLRFLKGIREQVSA